ncbi:YetF domain-containing protein [Paenibacillus sp.]|uniref:YetF domain-containing protein n=1 Tax=Paenibacillus sp. TaxID=58172 RepID=UPI0028AC8A61|nr:YetF domain-containing protein [Paenibacillus sp.]
MRKSEDEQSVQSSAFSITIIDKGRLLEDSMRGRQMNKMQIQEWVREQGYKCVEGIAYAEYKEDGSLYIIPKNGKSIDSGQLMSTVFFD